MNNEVKQNIEQLLIKSNIKHGSLPTSLPVIISHGNQGPYPSVCVCARGRIWASEATWFLAIPSFGMIYHTTSRFSV